MNLESAKTFLCDAMLGRLAVWLRILGYDAEYADSSYSDGEVIDLAIGCGRILLTRDVQMTARRALRSYGKFLLVCSDDFRTQLRQVAAAFDLKTDMAGSRCNRCNMTLSQVDSFGISELVPDYVAATQKRFKRCPKCGRIFWAATHWNSISNEMSALFGKEQAE